MSTFNLWWTLGGTVVLLVVLLAGSEHKVRFPVSSHKSGLKSYLCRMIQNLSLLITKSMVLLMYQTLLRTEYV